MKDPDDFDYQEWVDNAGAWDSRFAVSHRRRSKLFKKIWQRFPWLEKVRRELLDLWFVIRIK